MVETSKVSDELANRLWAIANDLRGNMDANKFRNYILGVIFYRYLSERTEQYMDDLLKNDNISYEKAFKDERYENTVKKWSIKGLGYIMEPKYFFKNMVSDINNKTFSIEDFEKAVASLTGSTVGQESEAAFNKLFDDMNLQDKDLGSEVSDRTNLISKVILQINDIDFHTEDTKVDILGTAYMILISKFASDAGKKSGEFFTAVGPAHTLAKLATVGLDEVRTACDPCAGSGSLLLDLRDYVSTGKVGHYYAQEMNGTTYNLLRMNMLMHGVPYKQFTCFNGDTIKKDNFGDKKFQVQVANPPYSCTYEPTSALLDDKRFSGAGKLAPKSYEDLMFLEHIIYHMDESDGRAAVLLPHGVLFRGGAEETIRTHIIKNLNKIDAVIGLPANMFLTTSIPVVLLVLKSDRNGDSDNILFIDASKEFKKGKKQNELTEENIDKIVRTYTERKDVEKYARKVPISEIEANGYNLNIPRYVDSSEEEEQLDLDDVLGRIAHDKEDVAAAEESLKSYFSELGILR